MKATAAAKMPLATFERVRRAARLEAKRTGLTVPAVYARWLIKGSGLGKRGAGFTP